MNKGWFKKGHTIWKGRKHNEQTKNKLSKSQKGRKFSEEHKRKLSEAHKGKSHPISPNLLNLLLLDNPSKKPEVRKKISDAQKGKHHSVKTEFKKGHEGHNKGGKISEEQKIKISQTLQGHIVSDNTKVKLKEIRKNQKIPTHHTKPEMFFESLCEKYQLPYKYTGDGEFWIGDVNPDFINSKGKKIAIEIFGDYWHSPLLNPKLNERSTATHRENIFKKHGWKVIIIWESDLNRDDAEKFVLSKIAETN